MTRSSCLAGFSLLRVSLVAVLCLSSAPAHTANWQVDLLIFRYLESAQEIGRRPQAPEIEPGAISLGDAAALKSAGITVLSEAEFGLQDKWVYLRQSRQFRPLIKLSWIQKDPPSRGGPNLRVQAGEKIMMNDPDGLFSQELFEIDGTVRLNLGRYLHIDTKLVYTQAEGEPLSWTLEEGRRMRSKELHHLDSAKLGVITRARRVGDQ